MIDQMMHKNRSVNWKIEQQKSRKVEQKNEKLILKNEDSLRDTGKISNILMCELQGFQKEKRKKGAENLSEELIAENLQLGKKHTLRSRIQRNLKEI